MTDHWFDRWSQDLARRVSRRQSLWLVSLLTAGLALGGATEADAGPKKPKPKPKLKPKPKRKPKPKGVCDTDSRCGPFSTPEGIVGGKCCPTNPAGRTCIPASWTCCPGNPPDAASHGAPPRTSCCQHDRRGYCTENEFCCAGVGCVLKNTRENCRGCGDHCGPYLTCLAGDAGCGCPPGWTQCGAFSCYDTQTHECCSPDRGDVRRIGECP